jgi:hypothetical protein
MREGSKISGWVASFRAWAGRVIFTDSHHFPKERQSVAKAKPTTKPPAEVSPESLFVESPPEEPSFPEWLQDRLRFGRSDDCVILFIPSHARDKSPIKNQTGWASEALKLMGKLYGGATGFPNLAGIWRDDENQGKLLDDKPIMIQSLARREDVADPAKIEALGEFLKRMGKTTKQGAVAVVFNNAIHFISDYD